MSITINPEHGRCEAWYLNILNPQDFETFDEYLAYGQWVRDRFTFRTMMAVYYRFVHATHKKLLANGTCPLLAGRATVTMERIYAEEIK